MSIVSRTLVNIDMTHRERLDELLAQIVENPEDQAVIADQINREFVTTKAIFILDMSGFSRTTQTHGIVTFLLMIFQMKLLAQPIIERNGGKLLKAEADNLFCIFNRVSDAMDAATEIMNGLAVVNHILPTDRRLYASVGIGHGDILVLDHDLFGDEVNLACKLGEDIAERGMILLTQAAANERGAYTDLLPCTTDISGLKLPYYQLMEEQ